MSKNKKQTAVDFLVEELTKLGYLNSKEYGNSLKVQKAIKQAKAMEKKMLWKFIESRFVIGKNTFEYYKKEFEQYYTETYGK